MLNIYQKLPPDIQSQINVFLILSVGILVCIVAATIALIAYQFSIGRNPIQETFEVTRNIAISAFLVVPWWGYLLFGFVAVIALQS